MGQPTGRRLAPAKARQQPSAESTRLVKNRQSPWRGWRAIAVWLLPIGVEWLGPLWCAPILAGQLSKSVRLSSRRPQVEEGWRAKPFSRPRLGRMAKPAVDVWRVGRASSQNKSGFYSSPASSVTSKLPLKFGLPTKAS